MCVCVCARALVMSSFISIGRDSRLTIENTSVAAGESSCVVSLDSTLVVSDVFVLGFGDARAIACASDHAASCSSPLCFKAFLPCFCPSLVVCCVHALMLFPSSL